MYIEGTLSGRWMGAVGKIHSTIRGRKSKSKIRLGSQIAGAIRRHALLRGIPLPMLAFGSLCSQHDGIMTKAALKRIMIAGKSPF